MGRIATLPAQPVACVLGLLAHPVGSVAHAFTQPRRILASLAPGVRRPAAGLVDAVSRLVAEIADPMSGFVDKSAEHAAGFVDEMSGPMARFIGQRLELAPGVVGEFAVPALVAIDNPDTLQRAALYGRDGIIVLVHLIMPIHRIGIIAIAIFALAPGQVGLNGKPGEARAHQRHGQGILHDAAAQIAREFRARSFARVAQCLVEKLAGRKTGRNLVHPLFDPGAPRLDLAFDLIGCLVMVSH